MSEGPLRRLGQFSTTAPTRGRYLVHIQHGHTPLCQPGKAIRLLAGLSTVRRWRLESPAGRATITCPHCLRLGNHRRA